MDARVTVGTQPYSQATNPASGNATAGYARPIIATVMLCALLTLFFSAGFWQLGRAAEKRAVLERFETADAAPDITTPVADTDAEALRFRQFRLQGHYLPDRQILLDNMTDGGANGYQVLTPFRIKSSGNNRYVLVNRGWVPASNDRRILPAISVDAAERTIVARLNRLPAPGLRLGQSESNTQGWPQRLLFPDRSALERALNLELPDYQLLLDAAQADGYARNWAVVDSGPEKHLGYAFQWFSFATLACIFYLILIYQWFRGRKTAATTQTHRENLHS